MKLNLYWRSGDNKSGLFMSVELTKEQVEFITTHRASLVQAELGEQPSPYIATARTNGSTLVPHTNYLLNSEEKP